VSKKIFQILFIVSLVVAGCIEPYSFDIENSDPPLVIESYISNVSYNESLEYPSDGRFFVTKLRYGQNLMSKGQNVTDAQVKLLSDNNESWIYSSVRPGEYWLLDNHFKATTDRRYKLQVTLQGGDLYESDWAELNESVGEMSDISFIETERIEVKFNKEAEKELVNVRGIELTVDLPINTSETEKYYMWQYEPTWIFIAGRLSSNNPYYRCWVRGKSYLSQYTIHEDNIGGYNRSLIFIDVETNERVFYDLSVLVKQYIISEDYYNFLNELDDQGQTSKVFATPPYNLKTNYHNSNNKPVFGYFSVRYEEARRMYFSVMDLSYHVNNNALVEVCRSAIPPYAPDDPCDNCLYYNFGGDPGLIKPYWWH
jgi:hypothetical protein